MQAVTTIGLDIAKSVFQVHSVDAAGIRRQLWRMRQCANDAPNADLSTSISVLSACISVHQSRCGMSVHQWCTNDAFGTFAFVTRNSLP